MSNDVVIRSGKTLKVGDVTWVIQDSGLPAVMPTLFVENRIVNDVLYLSMAETVIDIGNEPEAKVCVRMRLDLVTAQVLRHVLSELIDMAQKPADKSQAN
jgi:hypothetical protein